MMKSSLCKVIFAVCINLVLFSCDSETNHESTQQTIIETEKDISSVLSSFYPKRRESIQIFEINISKRQIVKGIHGTIVSFPMNCFGVTHGKVKIELIECYSIQEMLLNGISTETTDGKLLESDGMIYLNAFNEKGDKLLIKNGKVNILMPTKKRKEDIQIFEGVENSNKIIWNLSDVKINQNSQKKNHKKEDNIEYVACCDDSIMSNKSIVINKQIKNENLVNYVFSISKMGWQNCDRFIEGETKQLIVNVPKESTGASYYLVLKNYNSSALPKQTTDGKLSFIIPKNEPFTIVAISSKGEDIYFNMMDYTGGKSEVEFSGLKSITRQELTDLLFKKFGKDIWSRPLA